MTKGERKVKFNVPAFIFYTLSVISAFACYFLYAFLPSSDEFTNSIEYSGKETVQVFGISFVAGILSAVLFAVMAFVFRKYFYNLSVEHGNIGNLRIKGSTAEWISLIFSVLIFATLCTSAVLSFLCFKNFLDMPDPFLSPTDGTVYKSYEYVILGNTIAHSAFYLLTLVKMVGVNWLDLIARSIGKIFSKTKTKK